MMKIWELPEGKATYILRYFLPRPPYVEKNITALRLEELLSFCKRAKIEAVQFYVNFKPDWYYMPDTLEHAVAWAEEMQEYIPEIRKAGISYQLNFQNLLGSITGGVDHRIDFNWEYLVDHQGNESPGCACPLGVKFRSVMGKQLRAWAETKPDVIWIDDDFRMHNHGFGQKGIDWYCFCPAHLEKFSSIYGRNFSREQLVKELIKLGEVRLVWLDFLNDTMCETASWVCSQIHKISPFTRIAQMTSVPDVHAVEGRNWRGFLECLSGEGYKPIIRPHFGPYTEVSPASFVNSYTMLDQTMANIGIQVKDNVDYCPELENTRFTRWAKSRAATGFQLILGQLIGCRGITLSLFDLEGTPLSEEPLYEMLLAEKKVVLDRLAELRLQEREARGVAMLTDPDAARKVQVPDIQNDSIGNLMGTGRTWDSTLLLMGVPAKYVSPSKALEDEIIVLDGLTAWLPDEGEMKKILAKGVLLDSKAAEVLEIRGYGEMIGVGVENTFQWQSSAEEFHGSILNRMQSKRMPLRIPGGNWMKLIPASNSRILTSIVDPRGARQPGTVLYKNKLGGRVAIYSGFGNLANYDFFNHQRVSWSFALLDWLSKEEFPIHVQVEQRMLTTRRDSEKSVMLAFANLAFDRVDKIKGMIRGVNKLESVCMLCPDGTWQKLEHECFKEVGDGQYIFDIPVKLQIYDWLVLIISSLHRPGAN